MVNACKSVLSAGGLRTLLCPHRTEPGSRLAMDEATKSVARCAGIVRVNRYRWIKWLVRQSGEISAGIRDIGAKARVQSRHARLSAPNSDAAAIEPIWFRKSRRRRKPSGFPCSVTMDCIQSPSSARQWAARSDRPPCRGLVCLIWRVSIPRSSSASGPRMSIPKALAGMSKIAVMQQKAPLTTCMENSKNGRTVQHSATKGKIARHKSVPTNGRLPAPFAGPVQRRITERLT
jgi:hypothetical protein